jgi:TIR domain
MEHQQKWAGITVFYSYASADKEWRDQLAIHLSQLRRDGLIAEWSDQQILPGSDRAQVIDQALHSAHIILLLISADFLASDTCYQQDMQYALEGHQRGEARMYDTHHRPSL